MRRVGKVCAHPALPGLPYHQVMLTDVCLGLEDVHAGDGELTLALVAGLLLRNYLWTIQKSAEYVNCVGLRRVQYTFGVGIVGRGIHVGGGGIVRRLCESQRAGTRPAPTFRCLHSRGQAQGMRLPPVGGEQRAGTRPAPTFRWGGRGQAHGLTLPFVVWAAEGRHKACPYSSLSGRRCDMFGGREFAVYSVADRGEEGL